MPSLNSSVQSDSPQGEAKYSSYRIYFNVPFNIDLTSKVEVRDFNGKKYPQVNSYMYLSINTRADGGSRTSIVLSPEDWYRWTATVGELLHKVKTIYVDNAIADGVTDEDFKIVNFKGEVIQMVPLMAKKDSEYIPAVRIILNDPARFVDFPLIDIKNMYNIVNKIDVFAAGLVGGILGEILK